MNLSKEQEERLVLAIQGGLGILILLLSVRNSAKVKSKEMEKIIKQNIKQAAKLSKEEYKWEQKLLKHQYRQKLAKK